MDIVYGPAATSIRLDFTVVSLEYSKYCAILTNFNFLSCVTYV